MDLTLKGWASYLEGLPMPELRKDPIVGRWVIIATDRAKRPVAPKHESLPPGSQVCPFCEGHEDRTPPEVYALRPGGGSADTPGWKTRVVPNLYPALAPPGTAGVMRAARSVWSSGESGGTLRRPEPPRTCATDERFSSSSPA